MTIKRLFLGWNRPALDATADYLFERFADSASLDLSDAILAVPGGRAGRRLEELLLGRANAASLTLAPPKTVTVGHLPELLYTAKYPFADRLPQQLAWVEALRKTNKTHLRQLVTELPPESDLSGRLALGEMLAKLHRELAGDGLDFRRVAQCGADLADFPERDRWQALAIVQQTYLDTLDSLKLWDKQTARLYAVEYQECRTESDVVLIGTADLNLAQRRILDQVADRVTTLIFAPESLAERFDRHGCLNVPVWQDATLDLDDDQITVVDGPTDQAAAVVAALASFDGRFSAEEISIGVPSEALLPYVQRQLDQCGVASRYGPGRPIGRSSPYRLLAAVADYLETRSFRGLAALLRHPAVGDWLAAEGVAGDWLSEMDRYASRHLPVVIDGHWRKPEEHAALIAACKKLEKLIETTVLQEEESVAKSSRRLSQWGQPILELLSAVFGHHALRRDVEPDRSHYLAAKKAFDILAGNQALAGLGLLEPKVGAAEALRLILRQLDGNSIAPPADPDAVELLGWLELPLDDAPALVICGMNDQTIPDSHNADLFLPDRMRRQLGIEDNDRRYARDMYALSLLAASRKQLKLIAAKKSPDGDPLTPSRLFFADDAETTARRALAYFDDAPGRASAAVAVGRIEPGREHTVLAPPRPAALDEPVEFMRVTEFRDYLACPYRYYLKHRLRLAALSDWGEELDAAAFGSLAHEVLDEFGNDEVAASCHVEEISGFLTDSLDRFARMFYGKEPLPAIRVQIEQLRHRLMHFAQWQADWAGQGWRIESVEQKLEGHGAVLLVDDVPLELHGRVDRIDVNQRTGDRVIFDNKTSDTAKQPEKTHVKGGEWVDLQLPLYRHMLSGSEGEGEIGVGYLVLPKDVGKIREHLAAWTEDDFAEADRVAEDVVRKIRRGEFWPPKLPPPAFSEEFAAICQDGQFGALADALREEGDDA